MPPVSRKTVDIYSFATEVSARLEELQIVQLSIKSLTALLQLGFEAATLTVYSEHRLKANYCNSSIPHLRPWLKFLP
jgi:hypothetical protein